MRRLTRKDVHFLIRYALSRLPKSLLRDIQLDRHEVHAPEPVEPH